LGKELFVLQKNNVVGWIITKDIFDKSINEGDGKGCVFLFYLKMQNEDESRWACQIRVIQAITCYLIGIYATR
jgi:hypothetical protein